MNEQTDRQMNEQTVTGDLDVGSGRKSKGSQCMMQMACLKEEEEQIMGPSDDSCSASIWQSPCLYLEQHSGTTDKFWRVRLPTS